MIKNIARGTTDPGIASITWIISPATKLANSEERKIQVKHSIGSNFGQMTLPALVLNLPTRWRHLKIHIENSIGSIFATRWHYQHKFQIYPPDGATIWWPNLYQIQVIEAMPGSVVPLAMFANRIKIWSSGDITSKVRRLSTRLSHLHCHIALDYPINLSVSIKLVSLSARVTSVKFQHGLLLSEREPDT